MLTFFCKPEHVNFSACGLDRSGQPTGFWSLARCLLMKDLAVNSAIQLKCKGETGIEQPIALGHVPSNNVEGS